MIIPILLVAALLCVVTILVLTCISKSSDRNMIPFRWNTVENFFELPFEIDGKTYRWYNILPNNYPIHIKLKNGTYMNAIFRRTKDLRYDILGRHLSTYEKSSRLRFDCYEYKHTAPVNIITQDEAFINHEDIVSWKPLPHEWKDFLSIFCY